MIEYSLITDEWRIGIRDGGDADRLPDIEPLNALATLTPVTAQLTTASDGIEPSWNLLLAPVTVTYENGKLVGTDSVEGVKVVAAINGRPVSWRVERTLTWENRRIPVPTIVIAPTPGGTFHLPDASPTSPDVDIRQAFITLGDIERTLAQTRAVNDEAVAGLERVNETIATIDTAATETRELLGQAEAAAETAGGHATAAKASEDAAAAAAAGVDRVVADAAGVLAGEIADDLAAAQAARDEAQTHAGNADLAAQSAETHAGDAATSATIAGQHAISAEASEATAGASRDSASQSALAAQSARDEAQSVAEAAATAAAEAAARAAIADLVGAAPAELDTVHELAAAIKSNQDGIGAINTALGNRVRGDFEIRISEDVPPAGTPSNVITLRTPR